jgi:hypothetical protein
LEQTGPYPIAVAAHIALPSPSPRKDLEMLKHKKGPEYYRRLAEKYREAAHTGATEKEQSHLLAMAKIWDLIAARVETRSQCERPAAVTDHGRDRLAR